MEALSLARFVAFALLSVTAVACAAERPTVSDESSGVLPVDSQDLTSVGDSSGPCTAGSSRECKLTWTDSDKQLHCINTLEYCKADGTGWRPCGEL